MAGYGIAGHRNSFSSAVRLGNWVEDHYGRMLAADPARGLDAEPVKETTRTELPSQLIVRHGLSRDLLFRHSPDAPGGSTEAMQLRALKLDRERRELKLRRSEAVASSQNVTTRAMPVQPTEPLPIFAKRKVTCFP